MMQANTLKKNVSPGQTYKGNIFRVSNGEDVKGWPSYIDRSKNITLLWRLTKHTASSTWKNPRQQAAGVMES